MSALPNQFPISLRSWPSNDGDLNKSLPLLIQRINSERGGFLDLDEDALREEIAKAAAGAETGEDGAASPEEEEEKPDRMKELMTARDEMLAQIEYAQSLPGICSC
jgi:mediator of RNA polymerase II transcription subunit 17, fungi type